MRLIASAFGCFVLSSVFFGCGPDYIEPTDSQKARCAKEGKVAHCSSGTMGGVCIAATCKPLTMNTDDGGIAEGDHCPVGGAYADDGGVCVEIDEDGNVIVPDAG